MNANLLDIVKEIVSEKGDSVLSEPKCVSAFLADLAREVPKPQKNALIKSLEHRFAETLEKAPESERDNCKQQLAQKLYDEEGLDLGLCRETLDLLAAVLFGDEQKKIFCKNCKKELQKEWKSCPYCSTSAVTSEIASAIPPDFINVKNTSFSKSQNDTQLLTSQKLLAIQPCFKPKIGFFDGNEIRYVEVGNPQTDVLDIQLYVNNNRIAVEEYGYDSFTQAGKNPYVGAKYRFSNGEKTIQIFVKVKTFSTKYKICIDGVYIGGDKF